MTEEANYRADSFARYALRSVEKADEARQTILEEHSAAFRWLMASLLALNAGGLLALANSGTAAGRAIWFGLPFLAGVYFSLLIGVFGQRLNRRMISHLAEVSAFWIEAYEKDHFDNATHAEILERGATALKRSWLAQVAGWCAALCFGIGGLGVGYTLLHQYPAQIERLDVSVSSHVQQR